MSLTITTEKRKEGFYLVAVGGRLDSNTYPRFEEKLAELLTNGVQLVTFDMEALEYISSMGLRAIFRAREAIKAQNGSIVLTKVQPRSPASSRLPIPCATCPSSRVSRRLIVFSMSSSAWSWKSKASPGMLEE